MSIPRTSIKHPVSVIMLALAMVIIGFGSLMLLNVSLFPNIDMPVCFIMAPYEGVDPSEMESIVTKKIEEQVNTVENIKELTSESIEGEAIIIIDFNYGTNIDLASVDVRAKVDLAKETLPNDMKNISTAKVDYNSMAIMDLAVNGKCNAVELRRIANREIKPALQQIPGVASVDIYGGLEREIRVKVFPEKLLALNLTIDDVINAIAKDNENTSLGNITEASFRYLLRSDGRMRSPSQIKDIIVTEIEGRPIYISELAEVEDSFKDVTSISRCNREQSVSLSIKKTAVGNPVIIAEHVRKLIPQIEKKYNGMIDIIIGKDQSDFIKDTIKMVKSNAVMGAIYAILVLFLFLQNYRSTLIIGISIPVAVISTFGMIILKKGITLNLMTLGGLTLGIGMMLDNAIVVLENIYRFYKEKKEDKQELTAKATEEVFMPVISSTATTVAAFLPIGFVPETVGELFFNMSISIVSALSASLVVALTLIPMLSSRLLTIEEEKSLNLEVIIYRIYAAFGKWIVSRPFLGIFTILLLFLIPASLVYFSLQNASVAELLTQIGNINYFGNIKETSIYAGLIALSIIFVLPAVIALISLLFNLIAYKIVFPLFNLFLKFFGFLYEKVLNILTGSRFARIVYIAVILILFSLSVIYMPEFSFFPKMDRGEMVLLFETAEGTAVEEVDNITQKMMEILLEQPEVEMVISNSQVGSADLEIKMKPKSERKRTTNEVIRAIRPRIDAIPGLKCVSFQEPKMEGNDNKKSLQIDVMGDDFEIIKQICLQIHERIKDIPDLVDLDPGISEGRPEFHLVFDREKLRDMGLNLVTIAETARTYIYGTVASKYRENNDEYDIRVEAVNISKDKIAKIKDLEIALGDGKFIKLSQIAEFKESNGFAKINRKNNSRYLTVQGESIGKPLGEITKEVSKKIKDINLPPGYKISFGGEVENMERSFKNLTIALIASLLLVYMIMAAQFESVVYPFLIMFTIPVSFMGVVLGFKIMNFPFSVTAMIGIIILAGIAVNNGIILIEYILIRKTSFGESNNIAVATAGKLRFRPILMTTSTTLLGMLSLSLGYGSGADFYQPLAIAVAYGLLVSTIMTLTFVPTLFMITEDIKEIVVGFIKKFISIETEQTVNS